VLPPLKLGLQGVGACRRLPFRRRGAVHLEFPSTPQPTVYRLDQLKFKTGQT